MPKKSCSPNDLSPNQKNKSGCLKIYKPLSSCSDSEHRVSLDCRVNIISSSEVHLLVLNTVPLVQPQDHGRRSALNIGWSLGMLPAVAANAQGAFVKTELLRILSIPALNDFKHRFGKNAVLQAFSLCSSPTPAAHECEFICANTHIVLIPPTPSIATLGAIAPAESLPKVINLIRKLPASPESTRTEVVGFETEKADVSPEQTKGTEGAKDHQEIVLVKRRDRKHKRRKLKGKYWRCLRWLIDNLATHKFATCCIKNTEIFKYLIALSTCLTSA